LAGILQNQIGPPLIFELSDKEVQDFCEVASRGKGNAMKDTSGEFAHALEKSGGESNTLLDGLIGEGITCAYMTRERKRTGKQTYGF
jgi:hypothetical protein